MYWEFNIAYEAEPKMVIDKNGDIDYTEGRHKYCLKDQDGNRWSSYYDDIIYLGNNHFAVANYEPQIVTFNKYSNGKIVESKTTAPNVKLKWGVIKLSKYNINNYDLWKPVSIIPFIYDSILPNNDNTATVEYKNRKTFVELDENSENYGEQLYSCIFNDVSNFNIDYTGYVKVKFNDQTGYIPKNIIKNDHSINLLNDSQVIELNKYFNGDISELNFDTRYKYMCLTKETPALTRILKNNGKN